jgi:hypothetical protein
MRNTKDLIHELYAEAANAEYVLLAVGFLEQTKFIPGDMPQSKAVKKLNKFVQAGGTPLGFIRSIQQGKERSFETRVLKEHLDAGDNVPGQVLTKIVQPAAQSLDSLGVRRLGDNRN